MKVLVLLAFVTVGQCALLGSRKCTYGPSYWCSHIQHARECKAMQHCMTTVWKNQLQGMTGTTESCFDVIKTLDEVRHSNVPGLLEKMAESCTKMTAEKRSVCKELMTSSPNEVLLLLQSDLPSVNIATALGLCGSVSDSAPQPHVEDKQGMMKSGNFCTDCLNFFGDLQEIVNNTGEKIAEKLKEKVCTKLGYFEQLCKETVDTYTGFIITILAQQLNPEDVCFLFQLCASETQGDFMKKVKAIAAMTSVECDVCMSFAKDVQDALRDTDLQNEIESALENKVCPRLPGNLSTECKTYVSQYGPLIFQVLVAELDPPTFCQTLGFCNATKMEAKPALVWVPLSKAVTTVRLLTPDPKDQAQLSPQCALCELVIKKLESMINTNATEEEIEKALEKVCSLLPDKYKAECDDFVKEYGKSFVKLLLEELAPEVLCTTLGLCLGDRPVQVDPPAPVKNLQVCVVCQTVVAYMDQYILNPAHTKTLVELLDEVCVVLPASYRPECKDIINTYAPFLLDLINKYDDPLEVCTELTLCKSNKTDSSTSGPATQPLLFMPMAELQPAMAPVACSQGPHVWCASLHNARRCQAVKYCVENKKLKLEE